MERSHRTDDEEFYLPFLAKVHTEEGLLKKAAGWVYYYNLERPHYGEGMDAKPPFCKLRELGYDLPEEFALFPPLVLDRVSADWALRGGNDLLAHYRGCTARARYEDQGEGPARLRRNRLEGRFRLTPADGSPAREGAPQATGSPPCSSSAA